MMPPDTAERMRRALDRLASNPRAVQTLARFIDGAELLAQVVDRRRRLVDRVLLALPCPTPATVCDPPCRTCRLRAELIAEFT